ncbi:MAG: PDZ domain-containing protein [Planctomycetia bacterium]|nr:PDZ domain-containing protein [Planctomycetia bacterium]
MKRLWVGIFSCALLSSGTASADDITNKPEATKSEEKPSERVSEEPRSDSPRDLQRVLPLRAGDRRGVSPFWIGAMCVPADPTLRAQLGLADGVGLVVVRVMPESPADKAGLKVHDVLATIEGKPAVDLATLMLAVDQAGDGNGAGLKLEIVRVAKTQAVTVVPAKRPEGDLSIRAGLPQPGLPQTGTALDPQQHQAYARQLQAQLEAMRNQLPNGDAERIQEWIKRVQQGENQPLRMQLFGPGVLMPGNAALPDGANIVIFRNGNEPAKVSVSRGKDKWEVSENELDKLPEDLREPIKGMLKK